MLRMFSRMTVLVKKDLLRIQFKLSLLNLIVQLKPRLTIKSLCQDRSIIFASLFLDIGI